MQKFRFIVGLYPLDPIYRETLDKVMSNNEFTIRDSIYYSKNTTDCEQTRRDVINIINDSANATSSKIYLDIGHESYRWN